MIRRAEVEDIPQLEAGAMEFHQSSAVLGQFQMAKFLLVWKALLGNGNGVIFIDEVNDQIIGAIGGICHRELYSDALLAEEMFWFVRPSFRGHGARLYLNFERWAREKGAWALHMFSLGDSMPEKLDAFYARTGYKIAERRYLKRLAA
jgi:GNAT superfamily N-acetyltransferase